MKDFFSWSTITPILAWILLGGAMAGFGGGIFTALVAVGLIGAVLAAVHHADIVALRVGEPYGTLVLALAVTLIEVSLIVSLMISAGADAATLARDTVFAAVMIILNGIIGICLLVGGARHREQSYGLEGVSGALATLVAITVFTLILPNFTVTVAGPEYSSSQLIFVSITCLILYGTFVLVQTVRHREYFLMAEIDGNDLLHEYSPTTKTAAISGVLLLICLVAVVLLAKKLAPSIEAAVAAAGAPKALVGIIIAGVVLLPEGLAAVTAAKKNRLQTSLNLALGSALATIGLTIPAVSMVALFSGMKLSLGIDRLSTTLLLLSIFITSIALRTGRTTILQGVVLLVIFAAYLFLTIVP